MIIYVAPRQLKICEVNVMMIAPMIANKIVQEIGVELHGQVIVAV